MKLSALTLTAVAANASAQATYHSEGPFNLVTVSDDASINGIKLTACHTGAAIESLCTYNATTPSQYHFNYTTYSGSSSPGAGGPTGTLGWFLTNSNLFTPEALQIQLDPASNVGLPLFYPGNTTTTPVAFDGNNYMNRQSSIDDTKTPPTASYPATAYYRWYICQTYYLGYEYETLTWVFGDKPPQNPSCKKTDVKRVFV